MRKTKRISSVVLMLCMLFSLMQPAFAAGDDEYWLKTYSDPHFNLSNEPDRVATVEEFVAYVTARAYWPQGSATTPATDKTGKQPSSWCAKYVQAEVDKKSLDPKTLSYTDPATLAFAAEFLSRCKGQYHYDYQYTYSFTNTSGLTAEQKMYLNVAADNNFIPYASGMDAQKKITRKELNSYLPDKPLLNKTEPPQSTDNGMKEVHVYFPNDQPNDESDDAIQLEMLKKYSNVITMVSFHAAYVSNHEPNPGNQYLRDNLNYPKVKEAIEFCNQNGILPLLSVSNYGTSSSPDGDYDTHTTENMLATASGRSICIQEIISKANEYKLKGVNIGFEFMESVEFDPASKTNFLSFIKELSQQLHSQGMVLMNSVGAYFTGSGDHSEVTSFYDYKTIGEVSDYVHVILYDDHSELAYNNYATQPGPVSSVVRIDRVLKYVTNRMPAGKVLLGMASYGVDYNTKTHRAEGTPHTDLLNRAGQGVTATTDGSVGGTFNYTDSNGDPHIVYLETDEGVRTRLYKMYRYGLCGASVFYMASDHPALYQYAKELSANRTEVMNAVKAGIVPVTGRTMYKNSATRSEFCDLIVALIESKSGGSIDSFLSGKGVSVNNGQFTDTSAKNVLCAAALGIVNGRGDGTFAPNASITRQEAAAMLSRLAATMGYSGSGSGMSFNDTSALGGWAKEAIAKVSGITDPTNSKRVMNGTGNNNFSPFGTYTREQAYMTMIRLYNAL